MTMTATTIKLPKKTKEQFQKIHGGKRNFSTKVRELMEQAIEQANYERKKKEFFEAIKDDPLSQEDVEAIQKIVARAN